MKINKYRAVGVIMIIFGILLFLPTDLDKIIRPITQGILMGSSKGKDILLFILIGITLILSSICDNDKIYTNIKKSNIPEFLKDNSFYLKISLIIITFLIICCLICEVYIRQSVGVGVNTIFVSMNPSLTSTSIIHSHIYKSVLGHIIEGVLVHIPGGIHTGSSLGIYVPKIITYLFGLIPILYLLLIGSLQRQDKYLRILLSIGIPLTIIGLIDGNIFATPTLIGIYFLLIGIFNKKLLNYTINKLKNEKINEILKKLTTISKLQEFYRKVGIKKILKNSLPVIIMLIIIFLRIYIAILGTSEEYYEVDILNASENIDLSEYNTLNITKDHNFTKVLISNEYNEMELLNSLGKTLEGKCDCYSLTWNFNSYLNETTPLKPNTINSMD